MSGLQNIINGNKSDGVSASTHAGMKEAGVGPYEVPAPPPPPPPQTTSQRSQVGSTQMSNEAGLRNALKARGLTDAQIDEKIKTNKQQTGLR
jgi:hypothetical protein